MQRMFLEAFRSNCKLHLKITLTDTAFKTKSLPDLKGRWEFSVLLGHREKHLSHIIIILPFLTHVTYYRCCNVGLWRDSQEVRTNRMIPSGDHKWRA